MIVISTFFKSEFLQMTFMNLNIANCNFCIHDDELLMSCYHRTWVICDDANSQMSELIIKFFFYFFKFYMLMQFKTMKHNAIYLNSSIEALCIC